MPQKSADKLLQSFVPLWARTLVESDCWIEAPGVELTESGWNRRASSWVPKLKGDMARHVAPAHSLRQTKRIREQLQQSGCSSVWRVLVWLSLAQATAAGTAPPAIWCSSGITGSLCVDAAFGYTLRVGGLVWLTSAPHAALAFSCDGRWRSTADRALAPSGPAVNVSGGSSDLGPWTGVRQRFGGGAAGQSHCTAVATVAHYTQTDLFEFRLSLESGLVNTATMQLPGNNTTPTTVSGGPTATAFPAFDAAAVGSRNLGFVELRGETLSDGFVATRAAGFPTGYQGGLQSGPLALFNGNITEPHPPALVIGAISRAKDTVLTLHDAALQAGASGYLANLPEGFETRIGIAVRPGLNAAYSAWGAGVMAVAGNVSKMTLDVDPLSRQLHYLTDLGSHYTCYNCREPMHVTLGKLKRYHDLIGLKMSLYHQDPFWWSHAADGHCEDGGSASANYDSSTFHYPAGMAATGLDFQLLFSAIGSNNTYQRTWQMEHIQYCSREAAAKWGMVVDAADSHHFWEMVFGRLHNRSNLRSVVWDSLWVDFAFVASHLTVAGRMQHWMSGFADTAYLYKLPIRLDQGYASDWAAGAAFPALVTGRVGGDGGGYGWANMGAAGALLASLSIRPMMDVLITTKGSHNSLVALHQLVVAVLTTGPLGIGDEVGATDVNLLAPALRNDSTILKPARPATRLDSWYSDTSEDKGEVWEALSCPAAAVGSKGLLPPWSARDDPRANSLFPLGTGSSLLWRVLLATGVGMGGRLVRLADLFPAPDPTQIFVVTEWGVPCANGSARGNCSTMVFERSRLNVTAQDPRAHGGGGRSFRLFNLVCPCMRSYCGLSFAWRAPCMLACLLNNSFELDT